MLARVLVGENGCTGGVQPFVTVSVVKVPVGVDEVLDRIGTNPGESVGDLGVCTRKTSIDEKFSVATGEDGDISAGAHEDADVATQRLDGNGSACSFFLSRCLNQAVNLNGFSPSPIRLSNETAWNQQRGRSCETTRGKEVAARDSDTRVDGHGGLSFRFENPTGRY